MGVWPWAETCEMSRTYAMALFAGVAPGHSVFEGVLDRYFDGEADPETTRWL